MIFRQLNALARSVACIAFNIDYGSEVHISFLLAIPENNGQNRIQLLQF